MRRGPRRLFADRKARGLGARRTSSVDMYLLFWDRGGRFRSLQCTKLHRGPETPAPARVPVVFAHRASCGVACHLAESRPVGPRGVQDPEGSPTDRGPVPSYARDEKPKGTWIDLHEACSRAGFVVADLGRDAGFVRRRVAKQGFYAGSSRPSITAFNSAPGADATVSHHTGHPRRGDIVAATQGRLPPTHQRVRERSRAHPRTRLRGRSDPDRGGPRRPGGRRRHALWDLPAGPPQNIWTTAVCSRGPRRATSTPGADFLTPGAGLAHPGPRGRAKEGGGRVRTQPCPFGTYSCSLGPGWSRTAPGMEGHRGRLHAVSRPGAGGGGAAPRAVHCRAPFPSGAGSRTRLDARTLYFSHLPVVGLVDCGCCPIRCWTAPPSGVPGAGRR